ncbi:Gfo/Idh/MocA family protein [Paenibacillus ginsengarvi]|uniref:Gfo/Idh/MocA family oxidoreductase n=1 Tax=Paenibacillus ginsengarvi TaxID=400777 RepID=A0A3B0B865_9BACL|nr:Gfo/Idh/MocA family oxidoreductase [Paenibacillus ginsengarvi]RKN70145.1 gfo/Idh/MocA family oxidoreductase [Paenibacillus ginsengarvi]
MTKLRIGIVGGGGIAQAAHINNYKKHVDRVELVAIADVNETTLRRNVEAHGFAHSFSDYREMFEKVELDAVSICTPNKFHAPATIAALRAGCHVLCEKPPAMTAAEAIQMEAAATESGKILTYGFCNRYRGRALYLKRAIEAGELGHIYAGRVAAMRRNGIPGGVFVNKELQGGGPLIDIGVHMLDLALWFMDFPKPVQVMGSAYRELGTKPYDTVPTPWDYVNYTVEDLAMGMIRFDNGATLLLETSFIVHMPEGSNSTVRLHGTKGGLDYKSAGIHKLSQGIPVDIVAPKIPDPDMHQVQLEAFIAAAEGNGTMLSTPREGVVVQQIIEALYRSAETGEAVNL